MGEHTERTTDDSSLMEDVYPLSPVQLGMVFHDLYSPDAGVYLNQYVFSLRGRLRPEVLRDAWRHVLGHLPVLRTAFVWEGMDRPVQVVFRHAALPWEEHDWRGCTADERRERLGRYLEAQRGRRFDLLEPPLLRLALVRVEDEEFELVWSYHHLLLDGWSISLVLQDVLASYDALLRGGTPVLPRRRSYRDYVAWLLRQDLAAAETYWRATLRGFAGPTPLGVDRAPDAAASGPAAFGAAGRLLSADATAGLQSFARQHRLTVNALVQGAWGVLLARYSGEEDVV
ncbi:MAG: non-ribosomal peptide synthetase, partial [Gemmatimonadetes bacterium]|nr:non-ribosomal peptide synthetase [Gemmatimonadota bacterium]